MMKRWPVTAVRWRSTQIMQKHTIILASYWNTKQLAEALASYRRALKLEPNSANIHYNLGNALRNSDN